jgi:hypothetical protein
MTVEAVSSETQNNEISEEKEKGDLNGREVEIKEHMDDFEKNMKEFLMDNIEVVLSTGEAVLKAIVCSPGKLIKGCESYEKAVELENAAKGLDKFGNPLRHEVERENAEDYEVDRNEKKK